MSQRGSGEASLPPDKGLGRRRVGNGRAPDRESARRYGGSASPEPPESWEADPFDPQELDRYLEDRARHIEHPRGAARSATPAESSQRGSGSRWSSSTRRQRRGPARERQDDSPPRPLQPAETPTFEAGRATEPERPLADDVDDVGLYDLDDPLGSGFDELVDPFPVRQPSRRSRRYAARPRPTIVMPKVQVPSSVAQADMLQDPVALGLLGASVLLAAVMALVTFSRVGDLPDVIQLRFDSDGFPARWGPPKSLWQLPLLVTMVTLINLVLAVTLSRFDRFASRFLLAASFVIGLVTWVPAARFLW